MYTVERVVLYVTYCYTNNKMIVYARNYVEYSRSLLNFNIKLKYIVFKGFHIALHA